MTPAGRCPDYLGIIQQADSLGCRDGDFHHGVSIFSPRDEHGNRHQESGRPAPPRRWAPDGGVIAPVSVGGAEPSLRHPEAVRCWQKGPNVGRVMG